MLRANVADYLDAPGAGHFAITASLRAPLKKTDRRRDDDPIRGIAGQRGLQRAGKVGDVGAHRLQLEFGQSTQISQPLVQ